MGAFASGGKRDLLVGSKEMDLSEKEMGLQKILMESESDSLSEQDEKYDADSFKRFKLL